MGEVLLRTEGVTKSYSPGVDVLRGVDLELRAGELLLIMGPSGSGKTTLLSILGCLLRPTRGRVLLRGEDVTRQAEADLWRARRRQLAFVFQSHNLLASLSALENVRLALELSGETQPEARSLLERVGLSGHLHARPHELSGGERQRVAVARALASPGRVLLADEPTGALDGDTGLRVLALLREAAEGGRAVAVVTHDPRLEALADRVVVMEDGRLARSWEEELYVLI